MWCKEGGFDFAWVQFDVLPITKRTLPSALQHAAKEGVYV